MQRETTPEDHPLLRGARWHLVSTESSCMTAAIDESEVSALADDARFRRRVEVVATVRFLATIDLP